MNALTGQIRSNSGMGAWAASEAWHPRDGAAHGEPLVDEEKTLNLMAEAEAAFGVVAKTRQQSVEGTKRATERLKGMYHALIDVQRAQTRRCMGPARRSERCTTRNMQSRARSGGSTSRLRLSLTHCIDRCTCRRAGRSRRTR